MRQLSCYNEFMRTFTSRISRFLLILIFFAAVSLANAAAKPADRLIVIRVANFGWNLAAKLKIDGQTVANIIQGRRYDRRHPGRAACSDRFSRTKYPVESADLDYPKGAAGRNLNLYRAMGFRSRVTPANGPCRPRRWRN